jgi:NADH-quinone oxidoreductase subunit L
MYVPLVALALLSFFGGVIDLPFTTSKLNVLDRWLELPESHHASSFGLGLLLSTIAVAVGVTGIYLGVRFYRNGLRGDGTDPAVERLGGFAGVLQNAYYLDIGLARLVSGPVTAFARFLSDDVDRAGIDGAVNGIAAGARGGGGTLRRLQTGLVRNYALGIALGTVLLLLYAATRVTF